jgi:hypothetical protein
MGTINYRTSDYITMAIRPYYYTDFDEKEIAEDYCLANDCDIEDFDVAPYIMDLIQSYYEDDLAEAENVLSRYHFDYYHVKIEYGYYEGFSLDIENNYGCCYDDWQDRRYANKEITKLKQMLIELADIGMVACYPFWIMRYEDYKGTLKCINEAIKEMRAEVKAIPTWNQLAKKGEAI